MAVQKKLYVVTVVMNAGTSHTVGPFATKQAADKLLKQIQARGVFGSVYKSVAFAQVAPLMDPASALDLTHDY